MADKKIPLRTCLVCHQSSAKGDLLRIVYNKNGEVSVDLTGKAQGRGAYICNTKECLLKGVKTKVLNKAFKTEMPADVYEELTKYAEQFKN